MARTGRPSPAPAPLHTVEEAAAITRTCTKWIYAQIRAGNLRVHRFGRIVRIDPEDLKAFIRGHRD